MSAAFPGYVAACTTTEEERLIKQLARARGVTVSALIRAWIHEHGRAELGVSLDAPPGHDDAA